MSQQKANILQKPHPTLTRDNDDIKTSVEIDLKEALTGWSKQVTTIDGKQLKISSSGPTAPTWTDIKEYGKLARDAGKRRPSVMENSPASGAKTTDSYAQREQERRQSISNYHEGELRHDPTTRCRRA